VRRSLSIAIALSGAMLASACGGGGNTATSPSSSPPPASPTSATGGTGTTIDGGSGSPFPTTSPGITGSVTSGVATVTVTGAVQTTQSLPLATPAVYAPPPGAFALSWSSAAAGVSMGGASFVGTQPTSTDLQLTLFVHASSGTFTFVSTDGSCEVTVTASDPTTFSGSFTCGSVSDATGAATVAAQGSFTATG
jgi:hypothetical protein